MYLSIISASLLLTLIMPVSHTAHSMEAESAESISSVALRPRKITTGGVTAEELNSYLSGQVQTIRQLTETETFEKVRCDLTHFVTRAIENQKVEDKHCGFLRDLAYLIQTKGSNFLNRSELLVQVRSTLDFIGAMFQLGSVTEGRADSLSKYGSKLKEFQSKLEEQINADYIFGDFASHDNQMEGATPYATNDRERDTTPPYLQLTLATTVNDVLESTKDRFSTGLLGTAVEADTLTTSDTNVAASQTTQVYPPYLGEAESAMDSPAHAGVDSNGMDLDPVMPSAEITHGAKFTWPRHLVGSALDDLDDSGEERDSTRHDQGEANDREETVIEGMVINASSNAWEDTIVSKRRKSRRVTVAIHEAASSADEPVRKQRQIITPEIREKFVELCRSAISRDIRAFRVEASQEIERLYGVRLNRTQMDRLLAGNPHRIGQ